jgi:glycosyltransferase involved in cell wall biosynthesis
MTRLHYISPSLLPSRFANSVHVVLQCDGLACAGAEISLYAKRTLVDVEKLPAVLQQTYGVNTINWNLITFYSESSRADTLRIALMAARHVLSAPVGELVLSRNLYAAWILASSCRPILFETHQLEYGVRKRMQRWIMTRPWVRTVAISNRLVSCLEEHHDLRLNTVVLHDAAPDGILKLVPASRRQTLANILKISVGDLSKWRFICGYFGQLYVGRGIEIIEAMAIARPACLFLVFGGNEADVALRRESAPPNLRFMGHVSHLISRSAQAAVDVLLMPYQHSVSIGIPGQDTARWMSPMKMFEYLAAGVPIISSDLPVLREILRDGQNCLLVLPSDPNAWVLALDKLIEAPQLAERIGAFAHAQYLAQYTWTHRAERLIALAKQL